MISYSRLLWWKRISSDSSFEPSAFCLHVGERLVTVDVWLALAEQVEVRPVQHEKQTTHIASSEEPGVVHAETANPRLFLGEPDGSSSERVKELADLVRGD